MLFNTWIYAAFLIIFFICYWSMPPRTRPYLLLTGGLIFYTYYLPKYTILITAFILVTYCFGITIYKIKYENWRPFQNKLKLIFTLSIITCLAVLFYYKYLGLFIYTANRLANLMITPTTYPLPEIIIPLGLSFFVFEFIHYLADMYMGKAPKTSLLEFGVFGVFFPTMVAGPIKRFQPFIAQLRSPEKFRLEFLSGGLYRIIIGIGKKVIVADSMIYFTGPLSDPTAATTGEMWLAVYAYAVKIYFDFSGYSDIAIGSAKLLGFRVPENFNYPYLQPNITAFWNNWHISLSSWIKDYIYIPLGGSRGSTLFTLRNLIIAMGLSGLWHGAAWNFFFWGIYHGLGLAGHRLYRKFTLPEINILPQNGLGKIAVQAFSTIFTFHFVTIGWVFFTCNISTAVKALVKLFNFI